MSSAEKRDAVLGMIVVLLGVVLVGFLVFRLFGFGPDLDKKMEKTSIQLQGDSERDFYHQLTDKQKKIYDGVLPAVILGEDSVTVPGIDMQDILTDMRLVTDALENDHPELFWFFYIDRALPNFRGVQFDITYYDFKTLLFDEEARYAELMTAVKALADRARDHSDNSYEQALFVHDQIIQSAVYDHDSLGESKKMIHDPDAEYIYSAYGCLVQGRTVCAGFAKAYQLVMRELGVDCLYSRGVAGNGAHAWNLIYLDDEHYFVDVTWDNPDLETEIPRYDYAFITQKDLNRTHYLQMKFDIPLCDDTTYQYFRYNGYYFEKYNFKTVSKAIAKQADNQAIYLQFSDYEAYSDAYNDLILQYRIKDALGNGKTIHKVSKNPTFNTLIIYF